MTRLRRVSIWGIRENFVDDTFNVTNQRVHDLCDEIIRRDLKFFLDRSFQSEGCRPTTLGEDEGTGCSRIRTGVEQGTEEGLASFEERCDFS